MENEIARLQAFINAQMTGRTDAEKFLIAPSIMGLHQDLDSIINEAREVAKAFDDITLKMEKMENGVSQE